MTATAGSRAIETSSGIEYTLSFDLDIKECGVGEA